MSIRTGLLSTTMLAGVVGGVFLTVQVARGADVQATTPPIKAPELHAPAVDGFNVKWDALGGTLSDRSFYVGRATLSFPLARQWGLQIDGQAGTLQRRVFGAIGGHLFWRDPARGLLGLYAIHANWNRFGGVHVNQVAGEGEIYFGPFTVQGIAGVEFGNSASSTTVNAVVVPQVGNIAGVATTNTFTEGFDVKTRFMDQINLKYYFTDNWNGYVGHRYLGGKHALALGAEAALGLGSGIMASAFVEARAGENQFQGVWGGLRFYLGQRDKTLIRRHREDEPIIWDTLHSIVNNYKSSGTSTSTLFCTNGELQPDGTCEGGFPSFTRR